MSVAVEVVFELEHKGHVRRVLVAEVGIEFGVVGGLCRAEARTHRFDVAAVLFAQHDVVLKDDRKPCVCCLEHLLRGRAADRVRGDAHGQRRADLPAERAVALPLGGDGDIAVAERHERDVVAVYGEGREREVGQGELQLSRRFDRGRAEEGAHVERERVGYEFAVRVCLAGHREFAQKPQICLIGDLHRGDLVDRGDGDLGREHVHRIAAAHGRDDEFERSRAACADRTAVALRGDGDVVRRRILDSPLILDVVGDDGRDGKERDFAARQDDRVRALHGQGRRDRERELRACDRHVDALAAANNLDVEFVGSVLAQSEVDAVAMLARALYTGDGF